MIIYVFLDDIVDQLLLKTYDLIYFLSTILLFNEK